MEKWQTSLSRSFKVIQNISLIKSNLKAMTRWYLTPAKLATVYPTATPQCFRGCQLTGSMAHTWWECSRIKSYWNRMCSLIQRFSTHQIPKTPAIALLNAYVPKMSKSTRKLIHFMLLGAKLMIAKAWKQPKVSLLATKRKILGIMSQEKLTSILLDKTNEFKATWEPWAKYMGITLIAGIQA